MPNMDLIITEATVVAWRKKGGRQGSKGEALLEIETDKAVTKSNRRPTAFWWKSSPTRAPWSRSVNNWEPSRD